PFNRAPWELDSTRRKAALGEPHEVRAQPRDATRSARRKQDGDRHPPTIAPRPRPAVANASYAGHTAGAELLFNADDARPIAASRRYRRPAGAWRGAGP